MEPIGNKPSDITEPLMRKAAKIMERGNRFIV
jgi:hypothetical protein